MLKYPTICVTLQESSLGLFSQRLHSFPFLDFSAVGRNAIDWRVRTISLLLKQKGNIPLAVSIQF
jgi:hypothetical protein